LVRARKTSVLIGSALSVASKPQLTNERTVKIGILSRNAKLYSTKRLKEAATARGHSVRVVDYTRCYMTITSRRPEEASGCL
jgi:hypothetical protein